MTAPETAGVCAWCGGVVHTPQRGWQRGEAMYCPQHHSVHGRHPFEVGTKAVMDAMDLQDQDPDSLIRWPFRDIHEAVGVLVPGRVYYVAAFPGNGKTSFLSACYGRWVKDGVRVTYLPLESDPLETVTRVACARAGVSADDALSMKLRLAADAGDPVAIQQRADLAVAFRLLYEDREFWQTFRIEPTEALTLKRFEQVVRAVREMESDILLVDHVDHVENDADDHSPEIQTSNRLQTMALACARSCKIPVVLATQLNSSKVAGDRLAHYRAPIMDWVYNKGKKEQIAALCLGTFRPLMADVDENLMLDAKSGLIPAWKVAKPGRMGVAVMKGRYAGSMKDHVVELAYERGVLSDLPPAWALGPMREAA